jgi:hypothetical protein
MVNPIIEQQFLSFTSQLTEMLNHHFAEQDQKIAEANQRSNNNFERLMLKLDNPHDAPAPSQTTSPVLPTSSGLRTTLHRHSTSHLPEDKGFRPPNQDHLTDIGGSGKDDD